MPPVVIAAGIGAAAGIGGAVMSAKASNKAVGKAADAQTAATNSQLALGRETNKLNEQIYNKNFALLDPFVQRGNAAGNNINALLGLGGAPTAAPAAGTTGGTVPAGGLQGGTTTTANTAGLPTGNARFPLTGNFGGMMIHKIQQMKGLDAAASNVTPAAQTNPVAAAAPAASPTSATDAFNTFANSAGMQFQLDQGRNVIEHGAAGRGALQSGAAMKSLQDYGQQTALNNYFMPYMSLLGGQQATGAQAGAAVAGVGSNFVNTAANVNAGMGNSIQNGANALSNAALLRGQNNANMWNGIASGIGGIASSFGGIK